MKKPKQRQVMELAKDHSCKFIKELGYACRWGQCPCSHYTQHGEVRSRQGPHWRSSWRACWRGLSSLQEWRSRVQPGKEAQFGVNTKFHPGCLWLNTLLKINLFIKYFTPLQLSGIVLGPGALAGRKLRNFCPHGKLEKYMLIPEPLIHFLTLKFSSSVYWNQLSNKIGIKISRS